MTAAIFFCPFEKPDCFARILLSMSFAKVFPPLFSRPTGVFKHRKYYSTFFLILQDGF